GAARRHRGRPRTHAALPAGHGVGAYARLSVGPRMRRSRAAAPPPEVRTALEVLLGASVARVTVIEHSWFARLHGAVATTRPARARPPAAAVPYPSSASRR